MEQINKHYAWLVALLLVGVGVVTRLQPHLPNFTPVTAIAFVSSWYLGRRWGGLTLLGIILISDLFIGWYDWRIMASVYGSFALIGLLSSWSTNNRSIFIKCSSVVSSSVLFFFVTNTAVWLFSPWYEKNLAGFLYSLELGVPFFRNMLTGDLVYVGVLVGIFELTYVFTKTTNELPRISLCEKIAALRYNKDN